jgi:3-hydroxyisobutyrate dehydrogenase
MKPTLGFIGLGLMGAPMATRLINAGYTLHVYNRTKEKAQPLLEKGAVWNNSAADVAKNVEIVFSMVTNDAAVREVTDAVQSSLRLGGIHIDCSTVSPAIISKIEKEYSDSSRSFLHSPVLGGIQQATEGSLLHFTGGDHAAFERSEEALMVIGEKIWRFPKAELASHTKLIMNSFIAGMMATLAQAINYADDASIGGTTVLDILAHSKFNAASFQVKGKMMVEKNFVPSFFLENLLKDTNLFRDAAQSLRASTPIADTAKSLLETVAAQGFGKEDYSAIIKALKI